MTLKNKKVLVTGAGGFIGSHLTEKLVNLGAKVTCFLHYRSDSSLENIDSFDNNIKNKLEIICGDLNDSDAVRKAAKGQEYIFHLGALIAVHYSYVHPRSYVQTNVLGTLNIIIAALENKVKKIIHTSTSEVYGTPNKVPIDENFPLQGQSPYSATKIAADKMVESFWHSYNLPMTIIRPFNTYGPRQSARAIIPTIITQAITNESIKIGNLNPKRDFVYVDDVVEGFILAAQNKNALGQTIQLSTNKEISIGELAKKINNYVGNECKIISENKRLRPLTSEVMRLKGDNSKAYNILKWKPKTNIDEGIKKTVSWISENIEKYKVDNYNI